MKSAVTISLVSEARGGPFVFWDDLAAACQAAQKLGFDAIELFPPSNTAVDAKLLAALLRDHNLMLAAVGTGAGWVKHKLHLALPDAAKRQQACDFIRSIIDFAAQFGAPAIIGSMQGRSSESVDHETALGHLADALEELGTHSAQYQTASFAARLIYEPLNRYETDQINRVEQGVALLQRLSTRHVCLLCDLFHMNIEEANIAAALRLGGAHVGHVHFVDSNRRPAGCGHLEYAPIMAALREIKYTGYLCAEALPFPDSLAAAQQTMKMFRQLVP